MLKKLKRSREHEIRESKRTLECILDNTISLLSEEDQVAYLRKKLGELGGYINEQEYRASVKELVEEQNASP